MNFIIAIPAMVWLIISAIFFALAEFLSKKFALSPSLGYIFVILMVDIISVLAWLPAILEKNQLSIVGVIWSVLSLATTIIIGVLIFGEKLNTVGIVGIIFALISVVLLSLA